MKTAERHITWPVKTLATRTSKQGYLGSQEQYYWDSLLSGLLPPNVSAHRLSGQRTIVPAAVDSALAGRSRVGVSFKSDTSGPSLPYALQEHGQHRPPRRPLWSGTGALLATCNFAGKLPRVGSRPLSISVAIKAKNVYVASYQSGERALERQLELLRDFRRK